MSAHSTAALESGSPTVSVFYYSGTVATIKEAVWVCHCQLTSMCYTDSINSLLIAPNWGSKPSTRAIPLMGPLVTG